MHQIPVLVVHVPKEGSCIRMRGKSRTEHRWVLVIRLFERRVVQLLDRLRRERFLEPRHIVVHRLLYVLQVQLVQKVAKLVAHTQRKLQTLSSVVVRNTEG